MSTLAPARRFLAETLGPLVDLIYPPRCPVCGEAIAQQVGLCSTCWEQLEIPSEPGCARCQRPFGASGLEAGAICLPCMKDPPKHDGIAAATLYNDVSRRLVLAFKHGRRIALTPMLARLMAARLPAPADRLIVPVPLHRGRLWYRGFNQAALLGRSLAAMGHGTLLVDALVRTKRTPVLGGLGAKARRRAVAGAIRVSRHGAKAVKGRSVILVDDVLTSGATSQACVAALKRAGATSVVICCFARVLDGDRSATMSAPPPVLLSESETPETTKVPGAT
ncbi:ComF family protein [Erythrobacter sp. QSSC1-22B]|uniref:ComF family protein n=1 Tax=Erythrobacter sp. QSSC1-22B TaxID=1860125 RepID=UPI0009F439B4|nr:ComF family protein [Erythrobacter sp. QSSC1-22B]